MFANNEIEFLKEGILWPRITTISRNQEYTTFIKAQLNQPRGKGSKFMLVN
jgi:hypothetical protein